MHSYKLLQMETGLQENIFAHLFTSFGGDLASRRWMKILWQYLGNSRSGFFWLTARWFHLQETVIRNELTSLQAWASNRLSSLIKQSTRVILVPLLHEKLVNGWCSTYVCVCALLVLRSSMIAAPKFQLE